MKAVCIVQARMGSKRLPGKIMMDLCGWPVLEHVLTRALLIKGIDKVVLALPDHPDSDEPAQVAANLNVSVVYGPEDDVLKRYVIAARKYGADLVMRITADCPLLDPEIASFVLQGIVDSRTDYCSNVHPRSWEKGLDVEVFTRWALEAAHRDATKKKDREHVTPWIIDNPIFSMSNVAASESHDVELNWSVDTQEDLDRVRAEFNRRYPNDEVSAGSNAT